MKIGKATKESDIPQVGRGRMKFQPIRDAVNKLKKGEYLPVDFETILEANSCANSMRVSGYIVYQRGNTVYTGKG